MNNFSIKILGSASPYPKGEKNGQGLLVKYDRKNILLNCGSGVTRLMNFPDDLDNLNIIISSLRPEFITDLETIALAIDESKKLGYNSNTNINLYLPDGNTSNVTKNYPSYGRIKPYTVTEKEPSERYSQITKQLSPYKINIIGLSNIKKLSDEINLKRKKTYNGNPEAYSFRICTTYGDVTYIGNASNWAELIDFSKDSKYLICGAEHTYGQYRKEGNLYANEAAKLAESANIEKLILTQLHPEKSDEDYLREAKRYFENVEIAKEGKEYILKK